LVILMIRFIRGVGLILGAIIGYQVALIAGRLVPFFNGGPPARFGMLILGIGLGAVVGWAAAPPFRRWFVRSMAWILQRLGGVPVGDVIAAIVGLMLGLCIAFLVSIPLSGVPMIGRVVIPVSSILVFGYLGIQLGIQRRDDLFSAFPRVSERLARDRKPRSNAPKLLDTSVIIDGRIAEICQAGFLEGPLLVPRPVLAELQRIADASDPLRRNRGRRGLDVLKRLREDLQTVHIYEEPEARPGESVDAMLVRLAQALGGSVVTTDYNLNKVAAIERVRVLNVNELANAIKPVMLPGEELSVHLIRDGKEAGQGVGYLEDGTMIVVEGGKAHIGETLDAVVTSVLQTVAGRMIFARPKVLEKDGAVR
jgi:uncharacterized protein YacL